MDLEALIKEVGLARQAFIAVSTGLSYEQAYFKPSPEAWSITEIVEHMVWAEHGGINGIWKAIEGIKNNKPVWQGEAIHQGLSIEQIIAQTWQPKENVPENARPRWGGPVAYWIASLNGCQPLLESLKTALTGLDPEQVIFPHVISGPLNVLQRMAFLRFHLQRHQKQIEAVKTHPDFPMPD